MTLTTNVIAIVGPFADSNNPAFDPLIILLHFSLIHSMGPPYLFIHFSTSLGSLSLTLFALFRGGTLLDWTNEPPMQHVEC